MTTAGVVFGLTMFAMFTADLVTIAQVGSTIVIGLLIDTVIVRGGHAVDRGADGPVVLVALAGG